MVHFTLKNTTDYNYNYITILRFLNKDRFTICVNFIVTSD